MLTCSGTGIHWMLVGDRRAIAVDPVRACACARVCVPAVLRRQPRRGLDQSVRKATGRTVHALRRAVAAGNLAGGDVRHGGVRHGVLLARPERATLAWSKFKIFERNSKIFQHESCWA